MVVRADLDHVHAVEGAEVGVLVKAGLLLKDAVEGLDLGVAGGGAGFELGGKGGLKRESSAVFRNDKNGKKYLERSITGTSDLLARLGARFGARARLGAR